MKPNMFLFKEFLIITILMCDKINLIQENENNVCKDYLDYFSIDTNENCYYNPDVYSQTPEIIDRYIGFHETYNVTTDDGYILTIFRIPRKEPKGVIILQHPLTADAIVWVGQSNESFAFLLWTSGYDIWLPNHRGTYFSRKHKNLTTTDTKYWDFSFHEIGLHDYHAIIKFVKHKVDHQVEQHQHQHQQKIIFVGHSMSSTAALIYASLRPKVAAKYIKVFITMSPVSYLKNLESPMRLLTPLVPFIQANNERNRIVHTKEYDSELLKSIRSSLIKSPYKFFFPLLMAFLQGWTPEEFDPTLINIMYSQMPRSYPWRIFYHYAQIAGAAGRFQMYDYGMVENMKIYENFIPEEYPIENIVAPIYLIYSEDDYFANTENSEYLYSKLGRKARIYGKLKISGINHLDFHYGKHRREKIHNKILELLHRL